MIRISEAWDNKTQNLFAVLEPVNQLNIIENEGVRENKRESECKRELRNIKPNHWPRQQM